MIERDTGENLKNDDAVDEQGTIEPLIDRIQKLSSTTKTILSMMQGLTYEQRVAWGRSFFESRDSKDPEQAKYAEELTLLATLPDTHFTSMVESFLEEDVVTKGEDLGENK